MISNVLASLLRPQERPSECVVINPWKVCLDETLREMSQGEGPLSSLGQINYGLTSIA